MPNAATADSVAESESTIEVSRIWVAELIPLTWAAAVTTAVAASRRQTSRALKPFSTIQLVATTKVEKHLHYSFKCRHLQEIVQFLKYLQHA